MFSGDPEARCARPRSICIVADDSDGLNPDAGVWALADLLRAEGFLVHVLWCGRRDLAENGPWVSWLDEEEAPAAQQARNIHGVCPSDRSDRVRHALERLHAKHAFDLIEFPALGGLGFRAVQAKAAGLAFVDVLLAVRLSVCTPWLREREHVWPAGPEDLEVDFIERYAFENACIQVAPDRAVLHHVRAIGWDARPDVLVWPDKVANAYAVLLERAASGNRSRSVEGDPPLVSICVAHYNLGRYLPETLASLAGQTYANLEVLVVDDGSTDPASRAVFQEMQVRYPQFRFVSQTNAGIGATRNRGLREARGTYYLPMDADNIACPHMVERFVQAIHPRPRLGAATCYFLAFRDSDEIARNDFAYACRPTGGPHVLASMRNVYGDATAIYRLSAFRSVGGYETDRDTSYEDWEAFVKLINGGWQLDVVPEPIFYYRHLLTGFSRMTDAHRNHQRVLRQFTRMPSLSQAEGVMLWEALAGFGRRLAHLEAKNRSLRYRIVDRLHAVCRVAPWVMRGLKRVLLLLARAGDWCVSGFGSLAARLGRPSPPVQASGGDGRPCRKSGPMRRHRASAPLG